LHWPGSASARSFTEVTMMSEQGSGRQARLTGRR
jgi:hypothetical protein